MKIIDAALEYLDRGFSVIPVKRTDKRPYVRWEEFQHRLPTADEIEHWWSSRPDANVAIICLTFNTPFGASEQIYLRGKSDS